MTGLPPPVARALRARLGATPSHVRPLGGGSINHAAAVRLEAPSVGPRGARGAEATEREVFIKWHRRAPGPRPRGGLGFFEAEADGLIRLRAAGGGAGGEPLRVPEVLLVEDDAGDGWGLLALELLAPAPATPRVMERAGRALASLHGVRGGAPGLGVDNFIGSLPQDNRPVDGGGWRAFFRARRVEPLLGALPPDVRRRVSVLDFDALLDEPSGGCALVHGDLWGGNLLAGARVGVAERSRDAAGAWFIDPAVYRGHPEVDLAMTQLFGGFSTRFYDAYQEVAGPFDAGLAERLEVLNLYPLLVHAALFGGGYVEQVDRLARRFGGRT